MKIMARLVLACALSSTACGGAEENEADEPMEAEAETSGDEGTVGEEPLGPETAERETLSVEECEARGGEVVGDIGDGAIHRPEYVCPSGQPPIGDVPLGIEGSVCCAP